MSVKIRLDFCTVTPWAGDAGGLHGLTDAFQGPEVADGGARGLAAGPAVFLAAGAAAAASGVQQCATAARAAAVVLRPSIFPLFTIVVVAPVDARPSQERQGRSGTARPRSISPSAGSSPLRNSSVSAGSWHSPGRGPILPCTSSLSTVDSRTVGRRLQASDRSPTCYHDPMARLLCAIIAMSVDAVVDGVAYVKMVLDGQWSGKSRAETDGSGSRSP